MKLVTVSGLMGSGKTSLIRRLVELMHARGNRSGVILNESGKAEFDDVFLEDFDTTIEMLRGG
jgi:G3E family GTPase